MSIVWIKDSQLPGFYKRKCASVDHWYVKARQSGNQPRTVKIGRCDVLSLKQARIEAKGILAQLSSGLNPNDLKREAKHQEEMASKHEAARGLTLQAALDECLSLKEYKPKTQSDMISMFNRNFNDWLSMPLRDITREEVLKRFIEIKRRVSKRRSAIEAKRSRAGLETRRYASSDGQGEAQKAFRYLNTVINSFMNDEVDGKPLLASNPCAVLKDKKVRVLLKERESYLDEQNRDDLVGCLSRVYDPQYKGSTTRDDADFILLLLMTGLRVNEARTLRWGNIDLNKGVFKAEDTKNGRDHQLPMTGSTLRIFTTRHKRNDDKSEWVFPSPLDSAKPSSMSKTVLRVTQESGVMFTPHDLRRTVATVASDLGYDLDKISAVLNHAKSGVTAGYVQRSISSLRRTLEDIEAIVLRGYEASGDIDIELGDVNFDAAL
jgi:integrase